MNYREIKKELLENENIHSISIDSRRKLIEINPVQDKPFYNLNQPLKKYEREGEYEVGKYGIYFSIGGKQFKRIKSNYFNTIIYSITLKEI